MADPNQLTVEATQQFEQGLSLVFSRWRALQMAVENGWGGPHSRDKALYFASRIFNFFLQPNRREPIYVDDVEALLDEGLDSLNTCADDGSVEEVAEQLMILHQQCLEGLFSTIYYGQSVNRTTVGEYNLERNLMLKSSKGVEKDWGI